MNKINNPLFAYYFGWLLTLMLLSKLRGVVTTILYYNFHISHENVVIVDDVFRFLLILHIIGGICYIVFKPKNRS